MNIDKHGEFIKTPSGVFHVRNIKNNNLNCRIQLFNNDVDDVYSSLGVEPLGNEVSNTETNEELER